MLKLLGHIFNNIVGVIQERNDGTNRAILDITKDEERLKKAVNVAEDILFITDKYYSKMTPYHQRKYDSLKKKFNKFD